MRDNVLLIWFSSVIGAVASHTLDDMLAPCNAAYLFGLIPCRAFNLVIGFPLGVLVVTVMPVVFAMKILEIKRRSTT